MVSEYIECEHHIADRVHLGDHYVREATAKRYASGLAQEHAQQDAR
jgi:hypothetical protein